MKSIKKFKNKFYVREVITFLTCMFAFFICYGLTLYNWNKGNYSLLITPIFIAMLFFPFYKYYAINIEKKILHISRLTTKIDVSSIKNIKVTGAKVQIDFTKNLRPFKISVTPEDIDGFIKALQEINGNITIGKINK